MFIFLTLLKVITVITGMGFASAHFFPGLSDRNNHKLKKALGYFLGTFLVIITMTAIEFLIIHYLTN